MEEHGRRINVQIFGTDIDENAVNAARSGLFPASIAGDVSEARLKRWFSKENNQYRIKKSIREMLVFAVQSIIKDPPFTKLDLLCCRNLLIYLGPELQKRLIPIFHYSLRAGWHSFSRLLGGHRAGLRPLRHAGQEMENLPPESLVDRRRVLSWNFRRYP